MTNKTSSVATPSVRAMEERIGKRVGLFDRMTSKSLGVTKAIDIAALCQNRKDGNFTVRLEYTESGDGVSVVFRDDVPYTKQVWINFVAKLAAVAEEKRTSSFMYCAEQIGLSTEELVQIIIENAPQAIGTMALLYVPSIIGQHGDVQDRGPDINHRPMIICRVCGTCAHSEEDLEKTACNPECENCKALRRSHSRKPAVPIRGRCNDRLHICPNDKNRWWQSNDHFHLWQQVTSDSEWKSLCNPVPCCGDW